MLTNLRQYIQACYWTAFDANRINFIGHLQLGKMWIVNSNYGLLHLSLVQCSSEKRLEWVLWLLPVF